MNIPEPHILRLLDSWARSSRSFALYRLPWTDECRLVLQTSGEVETLHSVRELNGRKGFVIAPFQATDEHPLVLIRPDRTACGWEKIDNVLTSVTETNDVSSPHSTITSNPLPPLTEAERYARYEGAFHRFMEPLATGRFRKLVLSRPAFHPLDKGFSPLTTFVKACNAYPRMMIYLCHTPVTGTWLGSTPEILLSGHGDEWHTVALAGTMPVTNGTEPTEWSGKNREEQALVAEYIRNIIGKHGREMREEGPFTARAGQLVHLKTDFRFGLKGTDKLGDLLDELHPTPAVCGLPKSEAYRFITENEGYDRRYYSGFTGWLDPDGHTDLYVNLRCMEIRPSVAKLYAGGGILTSSEVASEFEETKEKLKTIENII